MAVGRDKSSATRPVDGRGRAVTTPEESQRLFDAIERRRIERGWLAEGSSRYALRDGKAALLTRLKVWSERSEWTPESALRVAVHGESPTPLEELPARLRRAVEARCSDRGTDPAVEMPPGLWATLAEGLLPGLPSVQDLFAALDKGSLPPATVQALLDVDGAMEWLPRSAERVVLEDAKPVPVESGRRVVIEFDATPAPMTLEEWFQVSGRAATSAPQMTDEQRGQLAAVMQRMLDDWEQRQGE
ncbi:hypothetical protein Franean1_5010 [Parafrankia sp. EAN1pec]|uniref:hypothetical protein n=1 Tax=Parafrankia sp. (strain EAN1pec) TaxID=298653 RepID=UPI0000543FEE|nr:hypothetical protein Franean1_5010 [Frankia sp. EAN1pec]